MVIGLLYHLFQAYRMYVQRIGHEEPRLPGLQNFSNDQIFFLSYAQVSQHSYSFYLTIIAVIEMGRAPIITDAVIKMHFLLFVSQYRRVYLNHRNGR